MLRFLRKKSKIEQFVKNKMLSVIVKDAKGGFNPDPPARSYDIIGSKEDILKVIHGLPDIWEDPESEESFIHNL